MFAYFGRRRGIVTVQKYLQDIAEDAKDWIKTSKLSKLDLKRAIRSKNYSHEGLHQLIDPLTQPKGQQVKQLAKNTGITPAKAYRILQYEPNNYNINIAMESKVFGLEGRKPHQILSNSVPTDTGYWKGRRIRKKQMSKQYITALNISDISSLRTSMPELFDPADRKIFNKIDTGQGSQADFDYLLRKYGKYLKR